MNGLFVEFIGDINLEKSREYWTKAGRPRPVFPRLFQVHSPDNRWKRRYFVLSKPAQSLPGAYHLNYYGDESCRRSKGCIDLEQCLEIIESLDSEHYSYLLAIKTTHKGRNRTYFLATDTEEQMTTWVRNLCSVCGMKPDDSPDTPQPPSRETVNRSPPKTHSPPSVGRSALTATPTAEPRPAHRSPVMTRSPPPHSTPDRGSPSTHIKPKTVTAQPRPAHTNPAATNGEEEYIPLKTCTSGPAIKGPNPARQTSVDSVPEEPAPPPPLKEGTHDSIVNTSNVNMYDIPPSNRIDEEQDDIYKVPPPSSGFHTEDLYKIPPSEDDDIYKVPPPRPPPSKGGKDHMAALENYDILPPRHSPTTPRSSSGESQKTDSGSSQVQTYDFPPNRDSEEVYDIPPSHGWAVNDVVLTGDAPPGRPPKPGHLATPAEAQEPYMNLPSNSKLFSNLNQGVDLNSVLPLASCSPPSAELYDIPRSDKDTIIANNNNDTKETILSAQPPPPLMCGPVEHKYINAFHGFVDKEQDVYLPMNTGVKQSEPLPREPRKSSSTDNEVEYTDMSGKSSFDSVESKPIYDHILSQPRPIDMPPPRPVKIAVIGSEHSESSISVTARTRSFKRYKNSPSLPLTKHRGTSTKSDKSPSALALPQRSDYRHPDCSTSEDDEDGILCSVNKMWGTTPPAPTSKDMELKYVDLEHEDARDEPLHSPHGTTTAATPTEYHEIDFLKTDALRSAKEQTIEDRNKKM